MTRRATLRPRPPNRRRVALIASSAVSAVSRAATTPLWKVLLTPVSTRPTSASAGAVQASGEPAKWRRSGCWASISSSDHDGSDAASPAGWSMRIVREMLLRFPITRDEAVGRINQAWGHLDYIGDTDVIFHETAQLLGEDHLLREGLPLYCGKDSRWWLGEEGLRPMPYEPPGG